MKTLTYLKEARKGVNHTDDGYIYLHHFLTGSQELVFASHAKAEVFAKLNGCDFRGVTETQRK